MQQTRLKASLMRDYWLRRGRDCICISGISVGESMGNGDSYQGSLGPWSDADLLATLRNSGGIGADTGLPDHVRFLANVAKLIRRRLAQPTQNTDPEVPAIFVFRPTPPSVQGYVSTRVPMLDNGLTCI